MGAFRYFKHFNLSVDSTFTIDGFSESKVYMVIGCHRYQQGGIYLIACGYGINLELKLIFVQIHAQCTAKVRMRN